MVSVSSADRRANFKDTLDLESDLGISSVAGLPSYPTAKVGQIMSDPTLTEAERASRILSLNNSYAEAVSQAKAGGAGNVKDQIASSIVKYLVTNRNWSQEDVGADTPVIKTSDIVVTAVSGSSDFMATAQAVMG